MKAAVEDMIQQETTTDLNSYVPALWSALLDAFRKLCPKYRLP